MERIRNNITRIELQTILVGSFILATIFSVEFPVLHSISEYASINSEDIALLILFLYFVIIVYSSGKLKLTLPRVTLLIGVASVWIVVTLTVAIFRSPEPITPSILWLFKWFSGVILFIIFQHIINKNTAEVSVNLILVSGLILAIYSVTQSILGAYRIRVFFGNPNTLSAFFTMVATLSMAKSITRRSVIYFIPAVLSIGAVITTGSRSGLLGLIVSLSVVFALTSRELKVQDCASLLVGIGASLIVIPQLFDRSVISRLTGWISLTSEGATLADTGLSRSFRVRLQLVEKAIDLFSQQPIFGYGWFAVPSRVGYLDVYYTILLVEIGIVGFILFLFMHISFIRSWLTDRGNGVFAVGSAGVAWYCGLLTQSIAGSFPRTPQILLLTFVLLVSSRAMSHRSVGE